MGFKPVTNLIILEEYATKSREESGDQRASVTVLPEPLCTTTDTSRHTSHTTTWLLLPPAHTNTFPWKKKEKNVYCIYKIKYS